jgi:hypothetical protein
MPGESRIGLIAVGTLQIVLGLICAALVLYFVAGAELTDYAPSARSVVTSAIVVYGVAAIYFVAVGLGAIRARRWARSLGVAVSAIWLAGGVAATLTTLLVIPRMLQGMPQPTVSPRYSVPLLIIAGILLPLALFLFFRSAAVRLACEARDQKPRWTERVPLPVLAMMLIMAFAAVALLANVGNPFVRAFGKTLTGAATSLALFAVAMLCAVIAVQLFRLREAGWWMLLLLQVAALVWGASAIIRRDFRADPVFIGAMLTTWLAHLAFLLYLRRFFVISSGPRTRRDD